MNTIIRFLQILAGKDKSEDRKLLYDKYGLTRIHIKQLNLTIARYITDVNLCLAWFFQSNPRKHGI